MTTAKKSTVSSSSSDRAEIRIGVSDNARELTIESTLSAGEVEALVAKSASSDAPLLLQDETLSKNTFPRTDLPPTLLFPDGRALCG